MLWFLLILVSLVNLVGALGPELGFDALWYHLTIPKIYLMWGKIDFIPGGLMYYSAMPRLGELLYLGSLVFFGKLGEVGPHLINWGAGIGAALLTYKIARKYLSREYSLLAALIFYATPLVGWQSGSAYVDLLRTFFEALALYFFLFGSPILAGMAVGLAVSTKTLALGSLGILGVLGILGKLKIKNLLLLFVPAILISTPWFIWSYLKTGYPFYPIGAGILDKTHQLGNLGNLGVLGITGDPISPVYLILLPFFFFVKKPRVLTVYVVLSFLVWLITPHTGGGRFLLPYLPAWAVMAGITIRGMGSMRNMRKALVWVTALVAMVNIGYRVMANAKVIPYLLGRETKEQYLCKHLDFATAVFVDCDGWFAKNIRGTDIVLVKGFHNLYYVNFPFIHETWYKGEEVDYVLEYKTGANSPANYFSLRSAVTGECLAGCNGSFE